MKIYEPSSEELLFHYCSAQTLMAMLKSRTVRFSDINMLNDSQEFRWGYQVFEAAATRLIRREGVTEDVPEMPKEFFDAVDDVVHRMQLIAHPFVACFSREPDSLEQWRAYGDDGRGYCVGFSAEMLRQLPVTMFEVVYDVDLQVEEVVQMLSKLYGIYTAAVATKDYAEFKVMCTDLGLMFASYKHPAFRSEREVRCVHAVQIQEMPKGGRRFHDPGGTRAGEPEGGQAVAFYVRDGHLTAHLDMPFVVDDATPIKAVITGPKNRTATGNLLLYLASEGLDDIRFQHSQIPYR